MGDSFPNGTISVMEIYKAREAADGTPLKGPDGKFVKGELLKIGVMGKGAGWGESVAARTPEWRLGIFHVYGGWKNQSPRRYRHMPRVPPAAEGQGLYLPLRRIFPEARQLLTAILRSHASPDGPAKLELSVSKNWNG